jgi:hypothetical protein
MNSELIDTINNSQFRNCYDPVIAGIELRARVDKISISFPGRYSQKQKAKNSKLFFVICVRLAGYKLSVCNAFKE